MAYIFNNFLIKIRARQSFKMKNHTFSTESSPSGLDRSISSDLKLKESHEKGSVGLESNLSSEDGFTETLLVNGDN